MTHRTPNTMTEAVWAFKRAFLAHHLAVGESVTATATRLGIERTYLVRLKREFGIEAPRSFHPAVRQAQGQP